MFSNTVIIKKPEDSKQLLHLLDMTSFFGNRLEVDAVDEASILNYRYGVDHTQSFNEFCDTMHTALYWLNENYSDMFMVEKTGEAINLSNKIEELDEDMYRIDIIFGSWLSFVLCDSEKMRTDFLGELSGMDEETFGGLLGEHADDPVIIETFTLSWIKKMIDPARAAAYGHYMLYFMLKTIHGRTEQSNSIISKAMTNMFIFTQSASRLYMMDQHNLPMN